MRHEKEPKEMSLYFAELAQVSEIVKKAGKDSFVTLDELAMSTDYQN